MRIITRNLFQFTFSCIILFVNGDFQVTTEQGIIKGKTRTTLNNRTFYSFTGIPYAKPPIGLLRFEPPQDHDKWDGVYDATRTHNMCLQFKATTKVIGNENCLFLNIYTPQLPKPNAKELLPVMFFIHGGSYVEKYGIPEFIGPKILLDKNIILVSINYRLGVFGFFSSGDAIVPGNNGLKDQAFALKWVKNNILNFGGDPNKITVFGHSAGGCSAHMHLFSPLSKELMQGVIAQSGTAFATWAIASLEDVQDNSKTLASTVGCEKESNAEMVQCLKNVEETNIMKATQTLKSLRPQHVHHFVPIIEPNTENAFLPEHPLDVIKSGTAANVPFMTGITSEEGSIGANVLFKNIEALNKQVNNILPIWFSYLHHPEDIQKSMTKAIKEFYSIKDPIEFSEIDHFIDLCGDGAFLEGAYKSVKLHTKYCNQPVFYYLFSYRGSESYAKYYNVDHEFGVTHSDELLYLFNDDIDFFDFTPTEDDKKIMELLTSLWSNFAYYGHPTPLEENSLTVYWKPVEKDREYYYHIKRDTSVEVEEGLFTDRAKFWINLSNSVKMRDEL